MCQLNLIEIIKKFWKMFLVIRPMNCCWNVDTSSKQQKILQGPVSCGLLQEVKYIWLFTTFIYVSSDMIP